MYKVTVVGRLYEDGHRLLQERSDLLEVSQVLDLSPASIADGVAGADAIILRTVAMPNETLARAPELKIVSRFGVGTDNLDLAYLSARKIPVAIGLGANDTSVAEHTLMMMLALAKDAVAGDASIRSGNWNWRVGLPAHDLRDKTVLIMGFGRIGQRVGKLCAAFDMKVLAFDPFMSESPVADVTMVDDFRTTLPVADFVCLHMPATPQSRNMIGEAELAAMKPSAFLINCARGGIVDENALAHALENKTLAGAACDVFAVEPPDPAHPLFRQERTLFSPHIAGLTEECSARMGLYAAQHVIDFFEGKLDPRVVVNREVLAVKAP